MRDLLVAWLALSFCISARGLFNLITLPRLFSIALVIVGVHFIFHELSHKLIAQRLGYWAEFRLWNFGVLLAVVMAVATYGRFIFAAPGAVYIATPWWKFGVPKRENGFIALAGPLTNLVAAFAFLLLTPVGLWEIKIYGYYVGLLLASFNLLPIPPLDGYSVLSWSPVMWLAIAIPAWTLFLMV
jgi:Zn-dependent protease